MVVVCLLGCAVVGLRIVGRTAAKVPEVASSVYERSTDFVLREESGCPRAFPWHGPRDRLAVIACPLALPESAALLESHDDYLVGEGDYSAVFQADAPTVAAMLAAPAPWDAEWVRGPYRGNVDHLFGAAHRDVASAPTIVSAEVLLGSSQESGNMIAVDTATNRVWFAYWDF